MWHHYIESNRKARYKKNKAQQNRAYLIAYTHVLTNFVMAVIVFSEALLFVYLLVIGVIYCRCLGFYDAVVIVFWKAPLSASQPVIGIVFSEVPLSV